MNSQEKKIVVGGVVIAALSSAGFSMSQGNFNLIDDDYKSPTIISEKTLASNESTSINTPKTIACFLYFNKSICIAKIK